MGMLLEDDKAKELFDMVKENNHMLKDMRRSAFIGGILQFVWWVIILVVLPYISWLFIQPYLESVMGTYNQVQGQADSMKTAAAQLDMTQIQKLLEQFGVTGNK